MGEVKTLYVVGIATDYCVYYSVLDAIELGYKVKVVLDGTRGIANVTVDAAVNDMIEKGAEIITAADVLAMECPSETEGESDSHDHSSHDHSSHDHSSEDGSGTISETDSSANTKGHVIGAAIFIFVTFFSI